MELGGYRDKAIGQSKHRGKVHKGSKIHTLSAWMFFFFQLSFSQRYISVLDNSIVGKDFLIIVPNNPYPVDLVLIQNFHFWIITKIDPKEKAPALI